MNDRIIAITSFVGTNFALTLLLISLSLRICAHLCDRRVSLTEFSANLGSALFRESSSKGCGAIFAGTAFFSFLIVCMMFVVIPFTSLPFPTQMKVGLIYIMAMLSMLAHMPRFIALFADKDLSDVGDDKISFLFLLELQLILTTISFFMMIGTLDLQAIVMAQSYLPWMWNIVLQPISFLLFFVIFLLRVGVLKKEYKDFSSIFTSHLYELMASIVLVMLFLGGWQIPFVAPIEILGSAIPIVVIAWPIVAVIISAVGVWKLLSIGGGRAFEKKSLWAGAPPLLVGLTLFASFILFGDWALPVWALRLVFQSIQIMVVILKTTLIYSIIVYLRSYVTEKYWSWMVERARSILLPIVLINVLMAVILSLL